MTKHAIVHVYGAAIDTENKVLEFNGELCSIESFNESSCLFYFQKRLFRVHKNQVKKAELLYPNVIYVREPSLQGPEDEVIVEKTDIANCYARRGSHWIKYIIAPESLILMSEEDEKLAEEKAWAVSDIIVSREKLAATLKEVLSIEDSEVDEIMDKL